MYSVRFTQTARSELIDAQDWYEGEARGLGRRFRQAVDDVAERMSASPLQFPLVYKNVRRAVLRRFPLAFLHHRGRYRYRARHRVFPCEPRSFPLATADLMFEYSPLCNPTAQP